MVTENEDHEERREPEEDGEAAVTVDVSEDNDDKDEGDEPAAAAPARKTRAEKKADRLKLRDEHERLRGEHQGLTQKVAQLESALQQAMTSSRREVKQRDDSGDPIDAELDKVYQEQRRLSAQVEALGPKLTKEQVEDLTREYQRLDTRKHRLIAEQVQRQHGPKDDTASRYRQGLEVMYPDVYGNESAREWAGGYYRQQRAKGRKDGPELVKEALEEARKEFTTMGRPAPTQTERARFSGVARGGGGSEKKAITQILPSKAQRKMADSAYSHVKDPNVRYQMWAKKAGKRLAEKGHARHR